MRNTLSQVTDPIIYLPENRAFLFAAAGFSLNERALEPKVRQAHRVFREFDVVLVHSNYVQNYKYKGHSSLASVL